MVSYRFWQNKTSAETTTNKRYDLYDFHVTLYQIYFLFFVIFLMTYLLFQYFITVVYFDWTNIHSDLFWLDEFIQRLKDSRQTSDLSRHTVFAYLIILIHDFSRFDQWI